MAGIPIHTAGGHRSRWNFLRNVAAGLIACLWREKKPLLNVGVKEQFLISN